MKKIILTDADGVLLCWFEGFDKFMLSKGYKLQPNTDHHYSMSPRYNITEDESHNLIREYNESPFISDLPPYLDSVKYIEKLADHGFKFVVISSLSSHPDSAKYRRQNLEGIFGNIFLEVMCIEMGARKGAALKSWEGSGFFWIEDHIENSEIGHRMGLRSILVGQDHNQHYDTAHFPIVGPEEPWKEIYEIICKEYNLPV